MHILFNIDDIVIFFLIFGANSNYIKCLKANICCLILMQNFYLKWRREYKANYGIIVHLLLLGYWQSNSHRSFVESTVDTETKDKR